MIITVNNFQSSPVTGAVAVVVVLLSVVSLVFLVGRVRDVDSVEAATVLLVLVLSQFNPFILSFSFIQSSPSVTLLDDKIFNLAPV